MNRFRALNLRSSRLSNKKSCWWKHFQITRWPLCKRFCI